MIDESEVEDTLPATDEIPQDLLFDGIRFMRSLTEHYGAEEGYVIWEKILTVIPEDVKNGIFLQLLCADANSGVKLRIMPNSSGMNNPVEIIKCIRVYTNTGLYEAKRFWDNSKLNEVFLPCKDRDKAEFIRELRRHGCDV